MNKMFILWCLVMMPIMPSSVMADETVIVNTYDLGWYDDRGRHDAYNVNTRTGWSLGRELRSFFLWNVPDFQGVVYEASLEVHLRYSLGATSPQTGLMYDITGINPSILVSSHGSGSAEGIGIFSQMGSGVTYGGVSLTGNEDDEAILVYPLNEGAIADINAARGGVFGIGIRHTTGSDSFLFSSGSSRGVQNLVLKSSLAPTSSFEWLATDLSVAFADTSTDSDGTIVAWSWDFGDGSTSSDQNGNHTYSAGGTYIVTLTVMDDKGVTASASMPVEVGAPNLPPTAAFTTLVTDLHVEFTDISTDSDGTIVMWTWDFGDGLVSCDQNTRHTYSAAGTYAVTLTVIDDRGTSNSISMPITVSAVNVPPTAAFTTLVTELHVEFTDTSTDSNGTIVMWTWDFGDGLVSSDQNTRHTYSAAGTYAVTLTVIDDRGTSNSISMPITVSAVNVPPTAAFTTLVTELHVEFTDTSTDDDGTIVSWNWDFGDGNTSTAQNPDHAYATSGSYEVELTVTDDRGGSRFVTKPIDVMEAEPPGGGCDAGGGEQPLYLALMMLFAVFSLRRCRGVGRA